MAGPLLGGSGGAERVGTLLVVNGDDVDEVRDWAATDPYAAAGLFEGVTVAPLNSYSVDGALEERLY